MKRYTMKMEKIPAGTQLNPEESKTGQWVHWLEVEELLQDLKEARAALKQEYDRGYNDGMNNVNFNKID